MFLALTLLFACSRIKSLASEETLSPNQFFKRFYKISHNPWLLASWDALPTFASSWQSAKIEKSEFSMPKIISKGVASNINDFRYLRKHHCYCFCLLTQVYAVIKCRLHFRSRHLETAPILHYFMYVIWGLMKYEPYEIWAYLLRNTYYMWIVYIWPSEKLKVGTIICEILGCFRTFMRVLHEGCILLKALYVKLNLLFERKQSYRNTLTHSM